MTDRIVFYTPTYRPVGGVVKIFDYLNHAVALGHDVALVCPEPLTDDATIHDLDQFAAVLASVERFTDLTMALSGDDVPFFSWPTHYRQISHALPPRFAHHRIVHIVQNVRHANPRWIDGYATRLLGRPMARIMVSDQVDEACRPWLDRYQPSAASPTVTIVEGHHHPFFARSRLGGLTGSADDGGDERRPVRVGYTTWKSEVGVAVEGRLVDDDRFQFRSIRTTAGWSEVRDLYHWADVMLCCPGPEEGFYLVGLEAMAAGALVVTSDAVGNRAYARWGRNCVRVPFDDAGAYVDALVDMVHWPAEAVEAMRSAGYEALAAHDLAVERDAFGRFLDTAVLVDASSVSSPRSPSSVPVAG